MTSIQFCHANGFPAKCYNYLFNQIGKAQFSFIERMGHGDFILNGDLRNYAKELIYFIEHTHQKPVIGLGHSSGAAVACLAASMRPDLFTSLILLDPILFSKKKRLGIQISRMFGFNDVSGLAKKAARRRSQFVNVEASRTYFEGKSFFKKFHPACFEDYLKYGLEEFEEGIRLSINPSIEAEIFRIPYTRDLKNLNSIEGYIIYGKQSDVFSESDANWWRKNVPSINVIPFEGGHMFPLEQPEETARLINEIIYCE